MIVIRAFSDIFGKDASSSVLTSLNAAPEAVIVTLNDCDELDRISSQRLKSIREALISEVILGILRQQLIGIF